jgi:hypothetical protein
LANPKLAEEREAKATKAQDAAVAYVDAFTAAVGGDLCTLYMHHSMRHLPHMIRDNDLDISAMSQQGFEHLLKQGKSDLVNFTNKRLRGDGQDKGRQYQVIAKERERKRMKTLIPMPLTRTQRYQLGGVSPKTRLLEKWWIEHSEDPIWTLLAEA